MKRTTPRARPCRRIVGFTLIELMVVIAIIVLAAGLMTPTITDFFRGRQLENIRGHFGGAFNMARLQAVDTGKRYSLVFFREGVRVYNEAQRIFEVDDSFNPQTSPAADPASWFVLGFLDKKPSTHLRRYSKWEEEQKARFAAAKKQAQASNARPPSEDVVSVQGLPRITFERDGSLSFATGVDVSSSYFKQDIPEDADIYIYQVGNNSAVAIDLQPQGRIRGKLVSIPEILQRPAETGDQAEAPILDAEVPEVDSSGNATDGASEEKTSENGDSSQ